VILPLLFLNEPSVCLWFGCLLDGHGISELKKIKIPANRGKKTMLPLILSSTSCSSSHRQTTRVGDRSSGGARFSSGVVGVSLASIAVRRPVPAAGRVVRGTVAPGCGARRLPTTAARAGQQRCPAATLGSRHVGVAAWPAGLREREDLLAQIHAVGEGDRGAPRSPCRAVAGGRR